MDNNNLFEHMDHFTQIKNIYKKAIMDRTIEKYMDDSDEEIIEAVSVKANKSNRDECNATAKRTNIMVIDVETTKTGELIPTEATSSASKCCDCLAGISSPCGFVGNPNGYLILYGCLIFSQVCSPRPSGPFPVFGTNFSRDCLIN